MNGAYPARFSVDYPDRALNRLTTALRIFTVIPIVIVLASIGGYTALGRWDEREHDRRRWHRPAAPAAAFDDPLPAEVPALVV